MPCYLFKKEIRRAFSSEKQRLGELPCSLRENKGQVKKISCDLRKKAVWQTSSQESHPLFQSTYWKHASSIFSVSAELIFCTTAGEYFLHRNRKSTLSLCTSFSLNLAKARGTSSTFHCQETQREPDTNTGSQSILEIKGLFGLLACLQLAVETCLQFSRALTHHVREVTSPWWAHQDHVMELGCMRNKAALPLRAALQDLARGCSIKANGCKPLHITLICK